MRGFRLRLQRFLGVFDFYPSKQKNEWMDGRPNGRRDRRGEDGAVREEKVKVTVGSC